ncbi:MAG: family 16 glycosylhydrolase [Rikenellaceae bacterium]
MKKLLLLLLLLPLFVACSGEIKISANLAEPTLNKPSSVDWVYDATISDEFEGSTLDTTKWYDHNPHWLGREPSWFYDKNVVIRDGSLILMGKREELENLPEAYHTFTSAAVQSKDTVLYGFFEIRCRAMDSALSSAFWLYVQDSLKQEEIDIFEICGRNDVDRSYEHTYFATSHYMLKTIDVHISDHVAYKTPYRLAEEMIVAGLEWNRQEIIWYVNGEEIRRRKNDYWHSPQTINFDSEAFPTWWGLPSESDNGGEFEIEYFRYWSSPELYQHIYRD